MSVCVCVFEEEEKKGLRVAHRTCGPVPPPGSRMLSQDKEVDLNDCVLMV